MTGGIGEQPDIDDNGRLVCARRGPDGTGSENLNIWELESEGNIQQLTFYNFPEEAVQPTLAAETGELVYVVVNHQTNVLSLVSERNGQLCIAAPDPGVNFGKYPDLSPRGLLVFQGSVGSADQTWWGIRASDGAGNICSLGGIVCPLIPISIEIDIKPGDESNCINNDGHGVIPMAILGHADFDVTEIDPVTVQLTGLAVKAVGKSQKLLANIEDVNGDGFSDLIVQIQDSDGTFSSGTTSATLTGKLFDGTPIEGTDTICIVP